MVAVGAGRRLLAALLGTAALCLGAESARGQDMPLPVEVQASLFAQVAQFDRTFDVRSAGGLVVGILFREDSPASVTAKNQFSSALAFSGLRDAQGQPPQIVEIHSEEGFALALESNGVDLLYVTPMVGIDLQRISGGTREHDVISVSGVPEFTRSGLAVGLDSQDGRARILINLPAAEAEGARFRPGLLKIAEIIGGTP